MPKEEKAVVDRIEEGLFVLLVGEDEQEFIVPLERLPEGAKSGSWLRVEVEGSELTVPGIDQDEEEEAVKQRIEDKLARLRQRGSRLKPLG